MEIKKVSENLSIKFEYFELFNSENEVETKKYILTDEGCFVPVTRDIILNNKNKYKCYDLKITIFSYNHESQANIPVDNEYKNNIMCNLNDYLNNKSSSLALEMIDGSYNIYENSTDKKLNVKISGRHSNYGQIFNY